MYDNKMLIVSADVLPEVFLKVLDAKHMLLDKTAKNVADATKKAGLSRSAFYKYRDKVFQYEKGLFGSVITIQASLIDKPGVLANVFSKIHESGANILTVNQNVPVNDIALVSFSISVSENEFLIENLFDGIQSVDGVLSVNQILRG